MSTDRIELPALARLPTHVSGLDDILGGGLFEGGVYFVQGLPGAGKTTLAVQVAFEHVRRGGRVLYVTMLAESHARLLQHMGSLTFFEPERISREMVFVSVFRQVEDDGLEGMTQLVLREALRHQATLMVFDGLVTPVDDALVDRQMRLFVHALQGFGSLSRCTTLMLTSNAERAQRSERTMVDGILELVDRSYGPRVERRLQVQKFRGGGVIRGEHSFCITDDGLVVYPRLETTTGDRGHELAPAPAPAMGVSTGIAGLDAMVRSGGLPAGSMTLLAGPTGAGKTTAALAFLSVARPDAPALMLAFAENAAHLAAKARHFGIDLAALQASGAVHLERSDAHDRSLDQIGHELLRAVDARGIVRLVVDDLRALYSTPAWSERGPAFLRGLMAALRHRGVAAVFVASMGAARDAAVAAGDADVEASFDNLVELRLARGADGLVRELAIVKVRDDTFDGSVRSLCLDEGRLAVTAANASPATVSGRSRRSPV